MWPGVFYRQTIDGQISMEFFKVGIGQFSHGQVESVRILRDASRGESISEEFCYQWSPSASD